MSDIACAKPHIETSEIADVLRAAHRPKDLVTLMDDAADRLIEQEKEVMALRNALADKGKPYVGEDTVALVLYFGSREDADGFADMIHEAKPGMVSKSVTV